MSDLFWSKRTPAICAIQSNNVTSAHFCTKHTHMHLAYFCEDDVNICCRQCLSLNHLYCLNVVPLYKASIGAKQSQLFRKAKVRLTNLMQRLHAVENNEDIINALSEDQQKDIGTFVCDSSNNKDLSDSCKENFPMSENKIKIDASNIRDLMRTANEENEIFNFIEKYGTDEQAFVVSNFFENIITDLECKMEYIEINRNITNHVLEISPQGVNNKNPGDVGKIKITGSTNASKSSNLDTIIETDSKGSIMNYFHDDVQNEEFCFLYDIDLTNVHQCSIYGLTVTENNMLLLCDSNYPRILVCDENDVYLYPINTRYEPWDIAVIPKTYTVVTSSTFDDHVLQFLDINKRSCFKEAKLKDSEQSGISVEGKTIFACSGNKVQVMNFRGNRHTTVIEAKTMVNYLHVCGNDRIILVSGQDVECFSINGSHVFTYNSKDLLSPGKPTTDPDDNVYIPGLFSHNIFKLTADGYYIGTILDNKDGINFPTAIIFNHAYTKMYVANNSGSAVKVFSFR